MEDSDRFLRKFADIPRADAHGYSCLTGENEDAAYDRLTRYPEFVPTIIDRAVAAVTTAVLTCALSACATPETSITLEEAKQVATEFKGASFTPPPRTANDVWSLVDERVRTISVNCAARPTLTEEEVRDGMRKFPPVETGDHRQARFAAHRALYEFYAGNYDRSVTYIEWAVDAVPFQRRGGRSNYLAQLATYQAYAGEFDKAENTASTALVLFRLARSYYTHGTKPFAWVNFYIAESRAAVAASRGRLTEAEAFYGQALAIAEEFYYLYPRASYTELALGKLLTQQGRLLEAENIVRNGIRASRFRWNTLAIANAMLLFSEILYEQGRYTDAETAARASVKLFHAECASPENLQLARAHDMLARSLLSQGRRREAMDAYETIRVSMERDRKSFQRLFVGNLYRALAMLHSGQTREAAQDLRFALERTTERIGENHYQTGEIHGFLAMVLMEDGDLEEALAEFAAAIKILFARSRESDNGSTTSKARDQRLNLIVESYIRLLTLVRNTAVERDAEIDAVAEAFRVADIARARSVQYALAASAARGNLNDTELADLARREQDVQKRITVLYGSLVSELSRPPPEQSAARIDELNTAVDRLRDAHRVLMAEIEKRYPAYSELINPRAMSIKETQASLRPGEALISTYVGENDTYVWAVPRDGEPAFAAVELGRDALARQVGILRNALEPSVQTLGDIPDFDLGVAYDLYHKLLRPVESGWKNARSLLVVAHGPLGYLPLAVLPTERRTLPPETSPLFTNYRAIPWLARSHAVTLLPAVVSLRTLGGAPVQSGSVSFAGFGDPWFSVEQAGPVANDETAREPTLTRRGVAQVRALPVSMRARSRTQELDTAALANLPRLPDTADELRSIAHALGADPAETVFTGPRASESLLKAMDLSGVRVLAFATHGLVPGDLDGLTQPALALSSPMVVGGPEDGLLTMGEILGLKLNADWVVLSACNTASAEGAGAEAVSGLGRAFFYAGARVLLVSNWPVETTSAKALTTDLFKRQARDPTLQRAEALRQSMLGLIDGPGFIDPKSNRTVFSYAHPIFWAPFSLVGDGGGSRPDT